ncbi:MAG TPA: ATP-binding cassette domain-containing protein, partial [Ktedonobacteraceae bacterium]|nr:ATP-binding cassette domain-containing protein [Ktedonobacteraceae bacterium]
MSEREAALNAGAEQAKIKSNTGEPLVVIDQLVKRFGKMRVVDNLSMNISMGETYGLIGPNGSGKTTLIRMMV